MEGLFFYWITWMFWILVVFFMNRSSRERFVLALSLLLLIVSSIKTITIFGMHFLASSFVIYFTILFLLGKCERKQVLSVFLSAFIVMLAFASFHIYELFDPVWLIFPRIWMMSGLLVVLSIFLQPKKSFRFFILVIGSIQGDFLYALIIRKFSFPYTIGSLSFLDIVSLSAVLLIIWNGIEILAEFYAKYYNQSEREKQKLS